MKVMIKILGLALAVLFVGCNKDDNSSNAPMSQADMSANAKLDEMSNDVSSIADDQFITQSNSGRMANDSYLPSCAEVTVDVNSDKTEWTRTVNFGADGCTLKNGNVLKGKIVIKGTIDVNQQTVTVLCTFDNFYHNKVLLAGTKTIVWEMKSTETLSDVHPVCTISEDFNVTNLTDVTLKITGNGIREMVKGYDTPLVWLDNEFSISGNRTVTSSKPTITATITSPLDVLMNYNHIVKGVITFTKNGKTAVLDYGDGTKDDKATITINGQTSEIVLGN